MSHIRDRLKQYADKYSDCYKYAGVHVKVIQDMIEQLQDDLELDEKENGWIPVSERLPEASGTYQVTCMDGRIYRSTYAKFQSKLKRWELTGARSYWKVTAWMPIPNPMKEDDV